MPKEDSIKVSLQQVPVQRLLTKYNGFLSKKDLGKIFSLSIQSPEKDLESITNEFLEKKYGIDKIEQVLRQSSKKSLTHDELIRRLGISRSRFYRRLNYLKRLVVKRRSGFAFERGRIIKKAYALRDQKRIKTLLKHKDVKRKILLNPGPVLTTNSVKNALIQNDICHRDRDFEVLFRRLQTNAIRIFDGSAKHTVLFLSGSGTSGMEAAISSTIPRSKKLLILINGAFGERLHQIAQLHNIKTIIIQKEWGELFELGAIEAALKENKDIFAIAMNHHETSWGILNPIREVGELASKYDTLFIVDAISSVGGTPISVSENKIDICIASANKALHAFSGVALICVHERVWDLIENVEPRSFYLDLKKYQKYSFELNQTPYTPAVANFFALDKAIQELLDFGLDNRHKQYDQRNKFLREELSKLGFDFFTKYGNESNAILTVKVPLDINFGEFYEAVKEEGFIIYGCKAPLAGKYFQIANMGALRDGMLYDFIFTVEKVLKEMRGDGKRISKQKISLR